MKTEFDEFCVGCIKYDDDFCDQIVDDISVGMKCPFWGLKVLKNNKELLNEE